MQAIRNIAIIAHVDHGKTTLVDQLLRQSGTFRAHQAMTERIMDSNDLEKERGITILAKNCAIEVDGTRINIVDTPGHADFGGEVERALSMVDCVLLVVDAVDGPMPQTRFVTRKALALGLKPILVVNKIDRPGSRPHWVIDQVFELFDKLGATHEQMDFPIVYCSALAGFAVNEIEEMDALPRGENGMPQGTMRALYDAILKHVPVRADDVDGPLQMQILSIDWSSYVGRIGVGRINRGRITAGSQVATLHGPGAKPVMSKVAQVLRYKGLERIPMDEAQAGDIVAVTGVDGLDIGATICAADTPDALPLLKIDEPTLTMEFMVNTSPLAGREGKYVTSRQIRDRLERELQSNVALRVEFPSDSDTFVVSGRGELHLTILLENMRREGYEMAVSRPKPKVRVNPATGDKEEPFETLAMDVEEQHQGAVMEYLGTRRADLTNMEPDGKGRVRLDYRVPARGLIGFHSEFLNITRGTGIMSHVFDEYAPMAGPIDDRRNGVLISGDDGDAVAYALWKLDDRGRMFVVPGEALYEGMIIGIHTRDNDLVVNPVKEKKLTNVRSAGKDDAIVLTPPMQLTLEKAVEFIADDELVEITPKSIRLRKRYLKDHERKRASRETEAA
jgi:GTP-binding protein